MALIGVEEPTYTILDWRISIRGTWCRRFCFYSRRVLREPLQRR
jgi:hypothetical protein